MAAYVYMKKLKEDAREVVYQFGPDENARGRIAFDKREKRFYVLQQVEGGPVSSASYEHWAAERIAKIAAREGGVFPEITSVEK